MPQKISKHQLLTSLLAPLVQEWGYETVRQCLVDLHAERRYAGASLVPGGPKPVKEYRRPSALEIVERLDAPATRKEILRSLAARFDTRTFLPSASDVRHFFEMRGQNPGSIKHRQDSFRKVLDALVGMADDELLLLQGGGMHAGPTQLGPLSDAIKATSAAARASEPHATPMDAEGPNERTTKGAAKA